MEGIRKCVVGWSILVAVLVGLVQTVGAAEHDSSRWEKDIQKFEEEDKKQAPPEGAVVFAGSSSIRLWPDLQKDFPGHKVIQRGFGGSQMADLLHYADRIILPYKPSKVVVYEGDNDIASDKEPAQVAREFEQLVRRIQKELPRTEVYFLAIKPSPSRWKLAQKGRAANALIESYAERTPRVHYVDIWTPMLNDEGKPRPELFVEDMLHMNREGYDVWVKALESHLGGTRK